MVLTAFSLSARAESDKLVFVELFTAEICPFCPQAERNFNDIIQSDNIIGYSCLVDYFESGTHNPYAQPFCKTQQDLYRRKIKGGSRYTPQLIINGRREMPGQNFQNVVEAIRLKKESAQGPVVLEVRPGRTPDLVDVVLPDFVPDQAGDQKDPAVDAAKASTVQPYILRMVLIRRRPEPDAVPMGRIRRDQAPNNLALAMEEGGLWDGHRVIWSAAFPQHPDADGLIVMVQHRNSGAIVAAGEMSLDKGP